MLGIVAWILIMNFNAAHRALLAVATGEWISAKNAFEEVLIQEPENLVVMSISCPVSCVYHLSHTRLITCIFSAQHS